MEHAKKLDINRNYGIPYGKWNTQPLGPSRSKHLQQNCMLHNLRKSKLQKRQYTEAQQLNGDKKTYGKLYEIIKFTASRNVFRKWAAAVDSSKQGEVNAC